MTPDQNQSHARVQALDLLRLVAVLGVVFYHYGFLGPQIDGIVHVAVPGVADFAKYGYLGVPIFSSSVDLSLPTRQRDAPGPASSSRVSVASIRRSCSA